MTTTTDLDRNMKNKADHPGSDGKKKRAKAPSASGSAAGAQVIHVAFGAGGGRIDAASRSLEKENAASSSNAETAKIPDVPPSEPVTDVFSPSEVAKLLNVTTARLRSLDKASIVSPTGTRKGKRAYTFQDLIALRATHDLLARSVKIRDVARAIGALRQSLPRVTRPLQELRITSDGRRMVVRAAGVAFEPLTGQTVLDFQVNALRDDVVRVLRPETLKTRTRTAYDLYAKASSLDEEPHTFDEAEALYKQALELDPQLAIAYTNLGNIRFRRGDEAGAETLYRRALEVDEKQPEAHYNLGYVMLERGQPETAVPYFKRALASDSRFADAHFNLAMAFEALHERPQARTHWKRYLELEPTGTWADIARQHLR